MLIKLLAMKNAYLNNEEGATAIEYALIAAGVSIGIISIVFLLGDELQEVFTDINTQLSAR